MSFDGYFTHGMVQELNQILSGGRIAKIHQPFENEVILVIRNQRKNFKLLLSAHPSYARMQITEVDYSNPDNPPNFCMMLRKYLDSAILEKIEQIENDRIIHYSFSRRNELGDLEDIVLVVELMGRHSAIILVNKETGKILDCLKHVGPSQNSYRLLLPGTNYIEPPKNENQSDPFFVDEKKLFHLLSTAEELTPHYLQQHFQGLGFDTANELCFRLTQRSQEKLKIWRNFFTPQQELVPSIYEKDAKEYFSSVPFTNLGHPAATFSSLSQLLDVFYEGKAEKDRVRQQAGSLIKKIETEFKKNQKKIKKLEKSLADTESADTYQLRGELLTTYLYLINPGDHEVTVENYYDNNQPLKIALQPELSPSKNAQRYFKRYNKLKTGAKMIREQLEKARQEENYLASVLSQLEIAAPSDIPVIREELIASGYVRERLKGKKKAKASKPQVFYSSDGDQILVGKNNLQNDQLTLRTAKKTDIWLHAKNIPGSHVIIKNDAPSEQTIAEAANLAGYFSKYRLSSQVPIDYVPVKHVRKPSGAKPGYVIYENQQTIYVTPDKHLVEKLKSS
ncbi:NFACT RNA binding domain-containing protein [Vagococcus elongatus]|uniref:Rqc2 homolog RqcH n=1 Tax=Vagococcus elongatus TaxID=180344 RepID=A0A430AZK3_9ENTE|nr:NFACT RNA binding domain-containing protein [Vagococcus elongatus]RSU13513.1 hypothetical protein CBF29_04470 [Vagococcus elongatus]